MTFTDRAIPNSVNAMTQTTRIGEDDPPRDVPAVLGLQRVGTSEPVNAQTVPIATGSYKK